MTDVVELDTVEGAAMFDRLCRRSLGMSGLEFLARYDRGDYTSTDCREDAVEAILALPFVREIPTEPAKAGVDWRAFGFCRDCRAGTGQPCRDMRSRRHGHRNAQVLQRAHASRPAR